MSHSLLAQVWRTPVGSQTAKAVYARLADKAKGADGTDGFLEITLAQIAADCDMGVSTVKRAIKLLVKVGLIHVIRRGSPGVPSKYRVIARPSGPGPRLSGQGAKRPRATASSGSRGSEVSGRTARSEPKQGFAPTPNGVRSEPREKGFALTPGRQRMSRAARAMLEAGLDD